MKSSFRHDQPRRAGVLVVNLGTPDAPTPAAVRRYLAEFLSDQRVVDLSALLWQPILRGVILVFRPRKVAAAYRSIWTEQGSPLLVFSQRLADALGERLAGRAEVALAMTYGRPALADAVAQLRERGVTRLMVLPLYPQYSSTTTAAVFDAVARVYAGLDHIPELRMINDYHDQREHVRALAAGVKAHWEQHGQPDRLLMSFHGIPQRYHLRGDPYPCQCRKTARLLAEQLGLAQDRWQVTFQSRFGREPWLEPATDRTLQQLAADGVQNVQVICPGFAVDCLETLEEIAVMNRELFEAAGGRHFSYIPALNDSADQLAALTALVERHGAGWPEFAPDYHIDTAVADASDSAERAGQAGALR